MTELSFMERRVQQLNTTEISTKDIEDKMVGLAPESKLLAVLVEIHDMIKVAQWDEERGRYV